MGLGNVDEKQNDNGQCGQADGEDEQGRHVIEAAHRDVGNRAHS